MSRADHHAAQAAGTASAPATGHQTPAGLAPGALPCAIGLHALVAAVETALSPQDDRSEAFARCNWLASMAANHAEQLRTEVDCEEPDPAGIESTLGQLRALVHATHALAVDVVGLGDEAARSLVLAAHAVDAVDAASVRILGFDLYADAAPCTVPARAAAAQEAAHA